MDAPALHFGVTHFSYHMTPYHRARCGSLIRETGADDLVRHEARCPACLEGWSIYDRTESEERKLDAPQHDQCRNGKLVP